MREVACSSEIAKDFDSLSYHNVINLGGVEHETFKLLWRQTAHTKATNQIVESFNWKSFGEEEVGQMEHYGFYLRKVSKFPLCVLLLQLLYSCATTLRRRGDPIILCIAPRLWPSGLSSVVYSCRR
ncbi:hypothetical protein Tco_1294648 [Tanacetum coccineum]